MIEIQSPEADAVNDGPVLSPNPVPEGSALYASLHAMPKADLPGAMPSNPEITQPGEAVAWSDQCAAWIRERPLTAVLGAFGLGLLIGRARR